MHNLVFLISFVMSLICNYCRISPGKKNAVSNKGHHHIHIHVFHEYHGTPEERPPLFLRQCFFKSPPSQFRVNEALVKAYPSFKATSEDFNSG